jgi:hypothetical protein
MRPAPAGILLNLNRFFGSIAFPGERPTGAGGCRVGTAELLALAMALIFTLNLPFGYWRAGLRKLSPAWFVAIHAPVPLVVALRFALGLPFRWTTLPLFVAAYFAGQSLGARLRQRSSQEG